MKKTYIDTNTNTKKGRTMNTKRVKLGTIFNVQLLANNPPEWENPRPVEVPDAEVERTLGNTSQLLERIFYWGQNDFQPRQCCSVSMGDVAEVYGKFWICKAVGWEEMSPEELAQYKALDQRDRTFSEFVRD